ncbi:MAG: SAM-dependent methyltransferase [Acidobacteriota bacterium]
MSEKQESALRNISDTALWVAIYRARETERPDAWFRDPYARLLAGERGEKIVNEVQNKMSQEWPFIARTVNLDRIVADCVSDGVDLVINLAAGLDTRPYRLELPADLKWIEVDLDDMIDYKEQSLAGETPRCSLERVRLDLRETEKRRELFSRLNGECTKALVMSEGLLVYLDEAEVIALAKDLAAQKHFTDWAIDLGTPALLKMMMKSYTALEKADAPLKFAPTEGPEFFTQFGWKPVEIESALHSAAKLKRLPWLFRLFALLPDSKGKKPNQVWGGVVRFKQQ